MLKLKCLLVCYCITRLADISAQVKTPLFQQLPSSQSGIKFNNIIKEDDSLNVFSYEYLYNGAGIGIADFNKDGLQDIFFSGNTTTDKLYLNKGSFNFEDITSKAGVAGNGTWSTGVSIVDINADSWPDIYVCHSGKYKDSLSLKNELFINQGLKNGIPVFTEAAAHYGLDAPGTQSTQAAFFDYDNDGDLDMFLVNHSNHTYNPFLNTRKQRSTPDFRYGNRLFRNDKKADGSIFFTDVTLAAGIINNALNFGLSVTVSDINLDGWPDIYTTSDYTEQDYYYVNNKNGTFKQSLQQSFTHISKYSMGSDIADYNNDGWPDVFTLDMLPEDNHRQKLLKGADEYDQYHLLLDSGYYHQQMRNMLHLNRGIDESGNVRFSEVGQFAGVSNTDWSWSGLLADLDNDGWKDMIVTNGYLRDYTDLDFLKYTVSDAQLNEAAKGNMNFKTYDLVKKMPSQKNRNYLFHNNGNLAFSDSSNSWGFNQLSVSNSAVYADLDNDGDLDIVIGNNNEPAMIFRNNAERLFANNYLQLMLVGSGMNRFSLGAKVYIYSKGESQFFENYPVRGYQSSVSPVIHIGLANIASADSLIIHWPNGNRTVIKDVKANQQIQINQAESSSGTENSTTTEKLFAGFAGNAGIDFVHRENDFIDFKDEVLLPYQLSRMGPALAKADVNNDGIEDIFIGGAINQAGQLYLQQKSGNFSKTVSQTWEADAVSEDVNAIFFDADNDGDNDLYVVSGGNEYDDGSPEYQDRLYINNGKGDFTKAAAALPSMISSKLGIAIADIDGDGDNDIFVGGYAVPGSFPFAARSYLLRNDSNKEAVVFTDITKQWNSELVNPGMVTTAAWKDLNKDRFPELIIGGEWMPVMIFENNGRQLKEISKEAGLFQTNGMWAALLAEDVDNDGDIDIIAGNCGLNNQLKTSLKEPMTVYASDFDDNGRIDAITTYYIQGKSYPMASRDELLDQIAPLKKKYLKYRDYADATINDIFPTNKVNAASKFYCYEMASVIFMNDGSNKFTLKKLPGEAQFSRISSVICDDFDKDGKKDILLTGNFFPYRNQLGMDDANMGVLLKGNGAGNFKVTPNNETGLFAGGDVRKTVIVENDAKQKLMVSVVNNDKVQVFKIKK